MHAFFNLPYANKTEYNFLFKIVESMAISQKVLEKKVSPCNIIFLTVFKTKLLKMRKMAAIFSGKIS